VNWRIGYQPWKGIQLGVLLDGENARVRVWTLLGGRDCWARTSCVREISENGSSASGEGYWIAFGGVISRCSKPSMSSASSMSNSNLNIVGVSKDTPWLCTTIAGPMNFSSYHLLVRFQCAFNVQRSTPLVGSYNLGSKRFLAKEVKIYVGHVYITFPTNRQSLCLACALRTCLGGPWLE